MDVAEASGASAPTRYSPESAINLTVSSAGGDFFVVNVTHLNQSLSFAPSANGCSWADAGVSAAGNEAYSTWQCPGATGSNVTIPILFNVTTTWSLCKGCWFVSKAIRVGNERPLSYTEGMFWMRNVTMWNSVSVSVGGGAAPAKIDSLDVANRANIHRPVEYSVVTFMRFGDTRRGAFLSIANPFSNITSKGMGTDSLAVRGYYSPNMTQSPANELPYHDTEPGILGFTALAAYADDTTGINLGERSAFIACVETFLMDKPMRENSTVKVNVAWDENDYQIDIATDHGMEEYKRIIDRNAQYGITHIVYEPQDTKQGSRFNTTDGWGWEGSLWFGMGERLREGAWYPEADPVPSEIQFLIDYAAKRGIKLLAYVYPTLAWEALTEYWVGTGPCTTDLGAPQVQEWLSKTLISFMRATGAGGFAWDHNIYAPQGDRIHNYVQWRGWMKILKNLREAFPDMVMDHRQTAHLWGPWYQLAGSYDEPIRGDENPESYGVPVPSLHADHVAADNMRYGNRIYASEMIPPSRVPGFIFHQTERTDDNGTFACTKKEVLCYDMNARDFDLLGYKYSILSTVATAGQNLVFAMIPARDPDEFSKLPEEDIEFVKKWVDWTDANVRYLKGTQPILGIEVADPDPWSGVPGVDGTSALDNDEGYVFLFNPGFRPRNVSLKVDESMGISNRSSKSTWTVDQVYPEPSARRLGEWSHGKTVSGISVPTVGALVLKITKKTATSGPAVLVAGLNHDKATMDPTYGVISVEGARGLAGTSVTATIVVPPSAAPRAATINGVQCTVASGLGGEPRVIARFNGTEVRHASPIGELPPKDNTGGTFSSQFRIPEAYFAQLAARGKAYNIDWKPREYNATWLVPTRLLAYVFILEPNPNMTVAVRLNGDAAKVLPAYNSRGLPHAKTFLGFYVDMSDLKADTDYKIDVSVPRGLNASQYQGTFWQNIEDETTNVVDSCIFAA